MRINTMRIVCPHCHTAYDVPDRLLTVSVRPLRCSACGHSWVLAPAEKMPQAPEVTPPPAATPAPAPKPVERSSAAPNVQAPPRPVRLSSQDEWKANSSVVPLVILVSLGVLLILLGLAVLEHGAIIRLFPASAPLFKALGLT